MNQNQKQNIDGVNITTEKIENIGTVTRVEVLDERGAKALGKPIGKYITLESAALYGNDADVHDQITYAFADVLKPFVTRTKGAVLVVGLGNALVVPDALGARTADKILVTNHIMNELPPEDAASARAVAVIKPGVMGATGIETSDIIKGVCDRLKPSLVIVVDALAARATSRVNTTIQLSDTGLAPGGGLGNARKSIDEKFLGCPVIAIGVPTVVDAATIASDTLDLALNAMIEELPDGAPFFNMLNELKGNEKNGIIKRVLEQAGGNMFVTPKDVGETIDRLANILSNGINIALQPSLTIDDLRRYMY